jgi:hypothetical protein
VAMCSDVPSEASAVRIAYLVLELGLDGACGVRGGDVFGRV